MNDNISKKDKKDWENFVSSKDKLPDKDFVVKKKIQRTKLIDLHGYNLDEANKTIEKFIIDASNNNINKLVVVTGKGIHSQNEKNPYVSKDLSILKHSVPEYILKNKVLMCLINRIEEAKVEDGGSGAFYIYLKKVTLK